jgi:hypothetical protein
LEPLENSFLVLKYFSALENGEEHEGLVSKEVRVYKEKLAKVEREKKEKEQEMERYPWVVRRKEDEGRWGRVERSGRERKMEKKRREGLKEGGGKAGEAERMKQAEQAEQLERRMSRKGRRRRKFCSGDPNSVQEEKRQGRTRKPRTPTKKREGGERVPRQRAPLLELREGEGKAEEDLGR